MRDQEVKDIYTLTLSLKETNVYKGLGSYSSYKKSASARTPKSTSNIATTSAAIPLYSLNKLKKIVLDIVYAYYDLKDKNNKLIKVQRATTKEVITLQYKVAFF